MASTTPSSDNAEIMKDIEGNIVFNEETKDTEIMPASKNIQEYLDEEVLPFAKNTFMMGDINDDTEENIRTFGVDKLGNIRSGSYNTSSGGIRPVVQLKSGLFGKSTVKENGDRVWTLSQTRIEESE